MITMTNMMQNYVKTLDETIPDMTVDLAMEYCDKIHQGAKDTAMCGLATVVCAGGTALTALEFGVVGGKTIAKRTCKEVKNRYHSAETAVVRR